MRLWSASSETWQQAQQPSGEGRSGYASSSSATHQAVHDRAHIVRDKDKATMAHQATIQSTRRSESDHRLEAQSGECRLEYAETLTINTDWMRAPAAEEPGKGPWKSYSPKMLATPGQQRQHSINQASGIVKQTTAPRWQPKFCKVLFFASDTPLCKSTQAPVKPQSGSLTEQAWPPYTSVNEERNHDKHATNDSRSRRASTKYRQESAEGGPAGQYPGHRAEGD